MQKLPSRRAISRDNRRLSYTLYFHKRKIHIETNCIMQAAGANYACAAQADREKRNWRGARYYYPEVYGRAAFVV